VGPLVLGQSTSWPGTAGAREVNGIHEVMGSIPISSTNSSNNLGTRQGSRDASSGLLCHVCVTSIGALRTPRNMVTRT
jgi:hypothetical protein